MDRRTGSWFLCAVLFVWWVVFGGLVVLVGWFGLVGKGNGIYTASTYYMNTM